MADFVEDRDPQLFNHPFAIGSDTLEITAEQDNGRRQVAPGVFNGPFRE